MSLSGATHEARLPGACSSAISPEVAKIPDGRVNRQEVCKKVVLGWGYLVLIESYARGK